MDASCVFRRGADGVWKQTDVCNPSNQKPDYTNCPGPKATMLTDLLTAVRSATGNAALAFQTGDVVLVDCTDNQGVGLGRIWFRRPTADGVGIQFQKAFQKTSPMTEIVPTPTPSLNHAPQQNAQVLNADGTIGTIVD